MNAQTCIPRRYRADLIFPPWEGYLPWTLPPSVAIAAPRGSSDDRHDR